MHNRVPEDAAPAQAAPETPPDNVVPIYGMPKGIAKITQGLAARGSWDDQQIADHVRKWAEHYPDELPDAPPAPLPFYTPAQLIAATFAEPQWIIYGYLAREAITEIDGKVKASGKTTLILEACRSILFGDRFLGQRTTKTKIVYVTEQQRGPFRTAVDRAKLHTSDDLLILFRSDFGDRSWPEIVEAATEKCVEFGAEVLIFDTIAKLAGITEENDSGAWNKAMTPLQNAAASGLAVLIARHSRKGGGEVGETGRGSSAGSGDVDIILDLRRPEGNDPTGTRRVLESLSRYEQTPAKLVINLGPNGYESLGDDEAVSKGDATRFVLAALRASAAAGEPGLSQDELADLGKDATPAVGNMSIRRALKDLTSAFGGYQVTITGRGVSRDPKRYQMAAEQPEKGVLSYREGFDRKESEAINVTPTASTGDPAGNPVANTPSDQTSTSPHALSTALVTA